MMQLTVNTTPVIQPGRSSTVTAYTGSAKFRIIIGSE